MPSLFDILTTFDWMGPSWQITQEVRNALKNMGASEQEFSEVDPELLKRLLNEDEPKPPPPSLWKGGLFSSPPEEEWLCSYCGTPQPMSHRKCDSCGGNRSFARR